MNTVCSSDSLGCFFTSNRKMCYKKRRSTTQLAWVFLLLCYAMLKKFISLLMEMCEWLEISWYGSYEAVNGMACCYSYFRVLWL
jgi:hypothetical protein